VALNRRALLKVGVAAVTGLAAPIGTAIAATRRQPGRPPPSPSVRPFTVTLPIPAVLRPASTTGGVDRFVIRQRPADIEILPGLRTQIWGYEGQFPGPTIEVESGRTALVRIQNELSVPTVTHLHGGVTRPEHDGYPLDLVYPVGVTQNSGGHADHGVAGPAMGSREHEYPNVQPAATLWYHDHRIDFTGPQVYRGLAGFYLIRDEIEDALALPRGERELPLMITDRTFNADGSLFYPSIDPDLQHTPGVRTPFGNGMKGDTVLVNGAPWPRAEVAAVRYRLRVLNASNARSYRLQLDPPPAGGLPFALIGSELGFLPRPVFLDSLLLGPAERFDVIVDFGRYTPGTQVVLRNTLGEGATAQVMRFDVAGSAPDESRIPESVPVPDTPFDEQAIAVHRRFLFIVGRGGGASTINMRQFKPDRVEARPRIGSVERWEFLADGEHPIHLHLGQFRVLSRVGMPPAAQDAGWKDSVTLFGGEIVLAVRYGTYLGKYVMHCHNLEHEDMMMMANIEVVQ